MSSFFISVVCASKNEESDILELCRSFKEQKHADKELIIVDDSSDNTKKVVRDYIKKHVINNIQIINGNRCGCCPARNLGVDLAKGDIICYMTADSYFPNNTYLSHVNIKFNTGIDAYMPNSLVANQSDLYADFIHCWQQQKLKLRGDRYTPLTSQGYCVKKSSAISVGLIDTIHHREIPFNVCRDWTLIKKMDEQGFTKEFDRSYFVPHTAPGDFSDFFWTHTQRGSISGGYNLYFRNKGRPRVFIESMIKLFRSILFYLTIFMPIKRALELRKFSSHNRGVMSFIKCDFVKSFSFNYGEISVIFK
ncbi:glycosyltransferase family 2 protein [Candidatus Woesearchaeota archaeon]|mgnify:FL=1|jgi:glycosyltransferase involved in cell wall biosynthesis|nr:glycosyltransferase family 2 protein [Candidatus Woesearchaeota archaeon]